jgi:guanylate kinase
MTKLDIPPIPLSQADQKKYDPQSLLKNAVETDFPLIYLNKKPNFLAGLPLVIIHLGPSGGGKDATIDSLLNEGVLVHSVTATSRERRVADSESESKYVWMRQQRVDETEEEYHANLIKEYDLIEYDKHFSALYGLPKSSVYAALQKGVPVIRTEPRGAATIIQKLENEINFVVTFVVPEDYQTLWSRIYNRFSPIERIEKAVEEIRDAPGVAHYFVFNPIEFNGQPGLPQVQNSLKMLVNMLHAQNGVL